MDGEFVEYWSWNRDVSWGFWWILGVGARRSHGNVVG